MIYLMIYWFLSNKSNKLNQQLKLIKENDSQQSITYNPLLDSNDITEQTTEIKVLSILEQYKSLKSYSI